MTSHHFDNLHPAMGAGGRAVMFNKFGYVAEGRVKPETIVCAGNVLVDRLGTTDHTHTNLSALCGNTEGILPAANYNRVKLELFDVFDYFPRAILKTPVFH